MIVESEQRIVVQMFMVNHVVLESLDHAAEVMNFKHEHAVVIEQLGDTLCNVIDFRNMCEHIICHDKMGRTVRRSDFRGHGAIKERVDNGNSLIGNGIDYVSGGIDTDRFAYTVIS